MYINYTNQSATHHSIIVNLCLEICSYLSRIFYDYQKVKESILHNINVPLSESVDRAQRPLQSKVQKYLLDYLDYFTHFLDLSLIVPKP